MSYFFNILDKQRRKEIIKDFGDVLAKVERPHYLVGTGMSGALAVSILSDTYDIPLMIVRKPNETTHGLKFEYGGSIGAKDRFFLVDDLVDKGETINRLYGDISKFGVVNGLYLYNHFPAHDETYVDKHNWPFPTYYYKKKGV